MFIYVVIYMLQSTESAFAGTTQDHREKENYSQIQLAHHRGIYTAYSTTLLISK
jgi:hypothetical protein